MGGAQELRVEVSGCSKRCWWCAEAGGQRPCACLDLDCSISGWLVCAPGSHRGTHMHRSHLAVRHASTLSRCSHLICLIAKIAAAGAGLQEEICVGRHTAGDKLELAMPLTLSVQPLLT